MKQKKREENLKKRRDEKGGKGKGKGKSVKSKKPKVKSRPGFEGSFGSGKRKLVMVARGWGRQSPR